MPNIWVVRGADKDSGELRVAVIACSTEKGAVKVANEAGMYVAGADYAEFYQLEGGHAFGQGQGQAWDGDVVVTRLRRRVWSQVVTAVAIGIWLAMLLPCVIGIIWVIMNTGILQGQRFSP